MNRLLLKLERNASDNVSRSVRAISVSYGRRNAVLKRVRHARREWLFGF